MESRSPCSGERRARAANLRLQVLRSVLKPALVAGKLKQGPFPLVGQVRRPHELKEPHLIWSDATFRTVMEAVLEARKFGLARGRGVARYIGARRGDLVTMPRSARAAWSWPWPDAATPRALP